MEEIGIMVKKMIVKSNCNNRIVLEGYVHYKRFYDGKEKKLVLKLYTINMKKNSKDSYVTGPIKVITYGNRAEEINKIVKEDMLVEVEGRLRITQDKEWQIIGVYINDATPQLKQISYEVQDEKEDV